MPFVIESSSIPEAIGAGDATGDLPFDEFTHRFLFETAGGDEAVALATFGDGPQLHQVKTWAHNAHGFDSVRVEEFDAPAEAARRKTEAYQAETERKAAAADAKRLVREAKDEAAEIVKEARERAKSIVAEAKTEAKETADKAKADAAETLEKAKADAKKITDAAKEKDGK